MSRKGAPNRLVSASATVTASPNRPIAMVARVLVMANSQPNVLEVIKNIAESISGDVSQNSITALGGVLNISTATIN